MTDPFSNEQYELIGRIAIRANALETHITSLLHILISDDWELTVRITAGQPMSHLAALAKSLLRYRLDADSAEKVIKVIETMVDLYDLRSELVHSGFRLIDTPTESHAMRTKISRHRKYGIRANTDIVSKTDLESLLTDINTAIEALNEVRDSVHQSINEHRKINAQKGFILWDKDGFPKKAQP